MTSIRIFFLFCLLYDFVGDNSGIYKKKEEERFHIVSTKTR